jgi:hypothetical protein
MLAPASARTDPEKFVNLMMVDELELEKWDPDDLDGLWKQGETRAKTA